MFNAIFVTKLPMPLREYIGTYLGNQSLMLLREVEVCWKIMNILYFFIGKLALKLNVYVTLPVCEFRHCMVNLYDLRLEFAAVLQLLPCSGSVVPTNQSYGKLLTRAVDEIVLAVNLFRKLHNQKIGTTTSVRGCLMMTRGAIDRLRKANRQCVIGQLIPLVP